MENNLALAIVGAISAIAGVAGKTLIDFRREGNKAKVNKRDDFTVLVEQMKYIIQRGEDKVDEQERQMKQLHTENAELKEMFVELKGILDNISIDPDIIEKINMVYNKVREIDRLNGGK